MRKYIILTFVLHAIVPSYSCCAWELSIDSALLNFRFIYASQMGSNGFFGPYNLDMSSQGSDFASMNGWFQRRMLSGTTAVTSSTRFAVFSTLKFNNAVSLTGTYRVAPENVSDPELLVNWDIETAFSRGMWTRLWMTVNTPLGKVFYGKRGFQQGCGLQFSNTEIAEDVLDVSTRTVEILQLETFYGPFVFGGGFYPWRRGSLLYWNFEDQNAARSAHIMGYLRYVASTIDTGCGGFYWKYNDGPESSLTTDQRMSSPPANTSGTEGWIYLKFMNGSFFINTEADWYYKTLRYQSSQDGSFFGEPAIPFAGGGSRFAPKYVESWRYMLEVGKISGPAKISVIYCHMPGPDRRHGILIDKQNYVQELEKSAFGIFYPYCLLMAKYYRAGVDSFRDMSASDFVASQLSYMLASNLDVFSSVALAQRSSDGYGYGYLRPNELGNVTFQNRGTFSNPVPTIPDRELGWEVNLGLAWRLLDNWDLLFRGAYWQPGKWFNYACIDKSVPNWDHPTELNNWGVNPNRTIDPVFGIELYLNAKL